MENISTVIKALFEKISGDEILKGAGYVIGDRSEEFIRLDTSIRESTIVRKILQVDKESTIDPWA